MKDKILGVLSENKEELSLEEVASILNVNKNRIEEHIESLKSEGIEFKISDEKYKILNSEKKKLIDELKESIKGLNLDYNFFYFKEVGSTNNIAKMMAENGAKEGSIVIADKQIKGKARGGKKWESPDGGLWLSIVLRPKSFPSKAPIMTLATGVAVAKTLQSLGIDAGIKWPNDILIGDKKICGILTEANTTFNVLDYIIVGIGLDSNVEIDLFTNDVKKRVTTMKKELNEEVSNIKFIELFLKNFDEVYTKFKDKKIIEILNEWRKLSTTIGKKVEIRQPLGRVYHGDAIGINNEGMLIIEEEDGNLRRIVSGECIIKN